MKKLLYTLAFLCCGTLLISCDGNDNSADFGRPDAIGKGGSMARFAITGDYLYTVDNTKLNLFNISTPADPQKEKTVELSVGVETIFPYGDKLFIGTQFGMHIFSIQNPGSPQQLSYYQHMFSCDPVVTDGRYAYVTLSAGRNCGWANLNVLQIVDLQNIKNPVMVNQYELTNPKGLAIVNSNLYICDNGLKVFDVSDVKNIKQKAHYNIDAYDVIPDRNNLLVIGSGGLNQYRIEQDKLRLLSRINVQQVL